VERGEGSTPARTIDVIRRGELQTKTLAYLRRVLVPIARKSVLSKPSTAIPMTVLHAYDATNLAHELYHSNQAPNRRDNLGTASHFGTPMIVNGKVYVGTTNGVTVFGLLKR
jgi:hypothetical protein